MTPTTSAQYNHAIIIGIDSYPDLKSLEGPALDAKDFQDWLIESGQCLPENENENVHLITSPQPQEQPPKPIKQQIDEAMAQVLDAAQQDKPGRLYVYFAGHGAAQEFDHLALLMANATLTELNQSINAKLYHNHLALRRGFPEQVFFYDCCRNYDKRVLGLGPPWTEPDPGQDREARVDQFIFFGSGFKQYAYERRMEWSEKRGLFTKALLEGLRGQAAELKGNKWVVTPTRLVAYVSDRVAQLAKEFSLEQVTHRDFRGAGKEIFLNEFDAPPLRDLRVSGPVGAGITLVIQDKRMKEFDRVPFLNGQAELRLPAGMYVLSLEPHSPGTTSHVVNLLAPDVVTEDMG